MSSSCAAHEKANLISFCKILFISHQSTLSLSRLSLADGEIMLWSTLWTPESGRWHTTPSRIFSRPRVPVAKLGHFLAFSPVLTTLIATFSRITRLFVRLVPMLPRVIDTKESVSSPEKCYWENIQQKRDRKISEWQKIHRTRAGRGRRSAISSTLQIIRVSLSENLEV